MGKKKVNKPRTLSYNEIVSRMLQRKDEVKNELLRLYANGELSMEEVSLLALMELYNQSFINDIVSNDLVQLLADGKKLPFYNKELVSLFKRIEEKRSTYAKYVREVLTTEDGIFCDAADMFEEEIRNILTLVFINIKQALDKQGVEYSTFRAKLEVMKILIYTSLDIYVEVCAASEISVNNGGDRTGFGKTMSNYHTNLSSIMWLVCSIEQYIGLTPDVDSEELNTLSDKMVRKVAVGELALDCLKKAAEGRDKESLPEWFPSLINIKDINPK